MLEILYAKFLLILIGKESLSHLTFWLYVWKNFMSSLKLLIKTTNKVINVKDQENVVWQFCYFLVSMIIIIVTFAFMMACVCMYVCMYVCDAYLVNMISQEGKLGQISYLVCRCTTLSTRTLSFLVEVKGHLGSTGVKLLKPCKHDISRRETWTILIFGM